MLVMQAATLVWAEITSANKVSASAGKAIVNQGEVTTLMLKTGTAIVKTGTANPKIAMLPKRMINFMNWEVYCMFERCSQISYLV